MGIAEFIVPAGSFFRLFLPFGEYGLLEKNERDQSLQKLDPREIESQELTHKKASGTMWTSKRVEDKSLSWSCV